MTDNLPTPAKRAFPIKSVTIDTFDKDLNGISEHVLRFEEKIPLRLDDPKANYADLLRGFGFYLIEQKMVEIEDEAAFFHIKTNVHKKVSISCLVNLRKKEKEDGTIDRAAIRKRKVDNSNN